MAWEGGEPTASTLQVMMNQHVPSPGLNACPEPVANKRNRADLLLARRCFLIDLMNKLVESFNETHLPSDKQLGIGQ